MKYQEVKTGETFSLCGQLLTICGIDNGSVILRDVRTGKTIIYGLKALQVVVGQFGYKIIA